MIYFWVCFGHSVDKAQVFGCDLGIWQLGLEFLNILFLFAKFKFIPATLRTLCMYSNKLSKKLLNFLSSLSFLCSGGFLCIDIKCLCLDARCVPTLLATIGIRYYWGQNFRVTKMFKLFVGRKKHQKLLLPRLRRGKNPSLESKTILWQFKINKRETFTLRLKMKMED